VKTDASPTSTGGSVHGWGQCQRRLGGKPVTRPRQAAPARRMRARDNRDASPNPDVGADTGGVPKTGGTTGSGGDTGGVPKTGGTTDTGGATRTGDPPAPAEAMNTGGATGTGGATRAGGSTSTGGTPAPGETREVVAGTTASCTRRCPWPPNATQQTRNVLCYSAQHLRHRHPFGAGGANNDNGMNTVFAATGKYPAIRPST